MLMVGRCCEIERQLIFHHSDHERLGSFLECLDRTFLDAKVGTAGDIRNDLTDKARERKFE